MKKTLLLFVLATGAGWSQIASVLVKTTSLSGTAEVITLQQNPTKTSRMIVRLVAAYVDCSVACTITLERNGSPASTTTLVPINLNPGTTTAAANGFSASNVGVGTVLGSYVIAAAGSLTIDLSSIYFTINNDQSSNLTIRTSAITGTVDVIIKFTESN